MLYSDTYDKPTNFSFHLIFKYNKVMRLIAAGIFRQAAAELSYTMKIPGLHTTGADR